jgi:hypothetical protein
MLEREVNMKKLLFVVAVLALVVPASARTYLHTDGSFTGNYGGQVIDANHTALPASTPDWEYDSNNSERKAESWNWPATYSAVDICVIPVKMDVGFWIKVNGCQTLTLNLKQRDIHSYVGSVTFGVVTNTNIALSVSWSKLSSINLGSYSHSESVSPNTLTPTSGNATNVTITETLTNVDLANLPVTSATGGNCVQVGTVTLRVTPNFTPVLTGGCGN